MAHIFKPKIPVWVNFGGSCNGRCWYILRPFGPISGHFVYCVAIWYILWLFGIFYGYLVYFSHFGVLYQDKSGNPDGLQRRQKLISAETFG
jgi:hypothetical protein